MRARYIIPVFLIGILLFWGFFYTHARLVSNHADIAFDYKAFQEQNGLLKDVFFEVKGYLLLGDGRGIFNQVKGYLQSGDVRGAYSRIYTYIDKFWSVPLNFL